MYRDGTLTGFSIGAQTRHRESSPPTAAELRARPELADCRRVYRSVELCEYSSVAVGSNPEALALAVSRGLWVPDEVRAGLPSREPEPDLDELPPLPERTLLPPLAGRRLSELIDARRAAVRAYARGELDDLRAQADLRRGVV